MLGHPDGGDGRYSDRLDYKTWIEFNNRMRVHSNYVEILPLLLGILVLGSLVVPKITMWVAIVNVVARIIYSYMYIIHGSDARMLGALTGLLPTLAVLILSIIYLGILAF